MKNLLKNKTFIIIAALLIILAICGVAIFFLSTHKTRPTVDDSLAKSSPAASTSGSAPTASGSAPAASGNPGDNAKSAIASSSPVAVTEPDNQSSIPTPDANGMVIYYFFATPQGGGKLTTNTHINGVKEGAACSLRLTSPSGVTSTKTGQTISANGSFYSCNFGAISGITEKGDWSAVLAVTSGGSSLSSNTKFTVSN